MDYGKPIACAAVAVTPSDRLAGARAVGHCLSDGVVDTFGRRATGGAGWSACAVLDAHVGGSSRLVGRAAWVGDEAFRDDRAKAWREEIEPSFDALLALTQAQDAPDELRRLERAQVLFRQLKDAQWWIEDTSQNPGNIPARAIMLKRAEPVARTILAAIASMMDLEQRLGGGARRKAVLGQIAALHSAFAASRASLQDLVADGATHSRLRLRGDLNAITEQLDRAVADSSVLTLNQNELLDLVRTEFVAYRIHCDAVMATSASEWDVSRNLLASRAAPLSLEVTEILRDLARRHKQSMEEAGTRLVGASNLGSAMLVLMLGAMAATATLLSVRGARRIAQPIALLARAAVDLSAGQLSEDIPVTTSDELGELTTAFNNMPRTLQERQEALRESEARTRAIVDTAADGMITIDETGVVQSINAAAIRIFGYAESEVVGEKVSILMPSPTDKEHATYLQRYLETGVQGVLDGGREVIGQRKRGETFPMTLNASEARAGGRRLFTGIVRDITKRKEAEAELERLNERLVISSREAGMAEIATGVLHNVGNVLNSVNVSATLVSDKIRKSKVVNLAKVTELMREHTDDLGTFITENEKGKKLPAYLDKLAGHLATEHGSMMAELEELTKNIEHIKKIVSTQQSHAGGYGVVETVSVSEVIEDALTVNATSFGRYGIEMVHNYADLPSVTLDKQKLLQLMVNLVRNAKHAVLDNGIDVKRLTLRTSRCGDERLCIEVIDNGVGISEENLTRIFSHGFTMKPDGHGFGLHSAVLAAKDMHGSLAVHSDGPGLGATFTLELPLDAAEVTA